ncbi:hypothetical protein [uncultured Tolumonas sp.]|uniref:hypothetical protein n=1 Tax=uncultured Tolumonas sp. TaxID=263765 RepID=UPI00292FAA64|nr:hypothetical protein [uncultured Tolumonas sp.]
MTFLSELIKSIEDENPDDWWINSRKESIKLFPELENELNVHEKALEVMDNDSKKIMFEKAKLAFSSNHNSRGKHQFFDTLNEALAYEYLINTGFHNVHLLQEVKKHKMPDIKFTCNGIDYFCEVKTIGASDNELKLQQTSEVFNSSIYKELNENFFNKLQNTISIASDQISKHSENGIIYIIINFDDFTLTHYETYQEQISKYLTKTFPSLSITLRIGIDKHYQMSHNNLNA